jgi:multiple sugar transport system substrate-binding protein
MSMDGPTFQSTDINPDGYPFFTGHVGMSENFLWSTYGLEGLKGDWDIAAIPAYQGKVTAAFNADTFRILKGTKHPDEAFEVLTYLLGEGSSDLLATYGGMPARTADQQAFFDGQDETFTQNPDWQVAIDGIQYADNPNFESFMPAYNETLGLVGSGGKYTTRWQTEQGLDMDKEIDALQGEIQAIPVAPASPRREPPTVSP